MNQCNPVNKINELGATSLSEALKINTTLVTLKLYSEHDDTQSDFQKQFTTSIHFQPKGCDIRDMGTIALCGALKSNSTLTELTLIGKDKKKQQINDVHQNHHFGFLSSLDNGISVVGARALSDVLNTCGLLKLDLSCLSQRKKEFTWHLFHIYNRQSNW